LQVYVRQLAPCEGLEQHGPGPSVEAPPAKAPFSIALALATARRLWLDFDAAASAGVRIQHALGHSHWRLVRSLRATARGPETVRLRYRALPRGVYRALITPDVAGAQRLTARFSVGIDGG